MYKTVQSMLLRDVSFVLFEAISISESFCLTFLHDVTKTSCRTLLSRIFLPGLKYRLSEAAYKIANKFSVRLFLIFPFSFSSKSYK